MNRFDVIVIGGGPAGVALSRFLSIRGHRIALLSREFEPGRSLALSIPPSARSLLNAAGLLPTVEAAGFLPNGGNTAWWAEGERRSQSFPRPGWQANAAGLRDAFLSALSATDVQVVAGTARRLRELEDGWMVECAPPGDDPVTLRSDWVVDASGRAGVLARAEGRLHERDLRTTALVRTWRTDASARSDSDATHTRVESFADGWAWSVPLAGGARCLTVMVDAGHARFRGRSLEEIHAAELAKAPHIAADGVGGSPVGPVWACSASRYVARRFARPRALLVGDAGAFIDPLSSYGVTRALGSAWLAGIVLHTCLREPSMQDAALDLFDAREKAYYGRHHGHALPFYGAAAEAYAAPFWMRRRDRAEQAVREQPPEEAAFGDVEVRRAAAAVLEDALSRVRSAPHLALEPGPTLRHVRRTAVAGDRIILDDHLATDASSHGVRFVRGIDLRRLVAAAPECSDVPALLAACRHSGRDLPDFLAALAYAMTHGFLTWRS